MRYRRIGIAAALLGLAAILPVSGAPPGTTAAGDISALTRDRTSAGRYGASLRKAWETFQSSDCKTAASLFAAVLEHDDGTDLDTVQALFGLGLSYRHLRPFPSPEKAHSMFSRIIEEFPEHPAVPWAHLELGKIARRKSADLDYRDLSEENAESRRIFRHILDQYSDSTAVHEAAIRLASTYFFESLTPEAHRGVEILEEHLAKYPGNPLEPVMLLRLQLWIFEIEQDYAKSVQYASKLGEMRMSDPQRWGRHFFHIAQTYRLGLGEPEKAARWYREIIQVTPKSRHVLSAKRILQSMEAEKARRGAADTAAELDTETIPNRDSGREVAKP